MIKKHSAAFAAFLTFTSYTAFTAVHASAASAENPASLSHTTGYYDNSQLVTVVGIGGESEIYFTTDGSRPGKDSALYDGTPITVSENTVVRIAEYSGEELVSTDKASIKIRTDAPTTSAEGGEYSDTLKVTLTCNDPDAVIYYTTDGSAPSKDSAKYKKAITISETTTLRFCAYAPDKSRSKVVTEKYIITDDSFSDPLCQALFELVNETRAEYGLKPLKAHTALTEAAQIRAREYSYYQSHYRPDGSRWDTILTAYGLKTSIRAENLAYYYTSAKQVMRCWMNDSFHRGNILNPDTEYIGLACYDDGWCKYWCQLFIG